VAHPIRVLHLEDSQRDAEMLQDALKAGGVSADIVLVTSKERFEAALAGDSFDIILSDYNIPGYDGIAAVTLAQEQRPETPVIVVSGTVGDEDAVKCLHVGATDYLLKQRLDRLVPAVQRALREAKDRRQRNEAEHALRQSERTLRDIESRTTFALVAAGAGVWAVELATDRSTWSATMAAVFGLTMDKVPKTSEEFFRLLHPDDRREVETAIGLAIAAKSAYALEFRTIWPDGSTHWIDGRGQASYDADGKPIELRGIGLDVTARKSLERQLEQSQKMESVGQLAGGIAHDFNNLLTVINGTAELAIAELREGGPLHEDLHEDLQEIRRAGERAAALTRQLLAFSRKQILQPQAMDFNAVVVEMESLLRRLIGEDIDLVVRPTQGLGCVKADPGQMEQVIVNLAVNARDAMPHGGQLTIETRNVEIDEPYAREHGVAVKPGPYVMLAISDTGVGMDQVTREQIFEPFFTTKGPGKGTGLGLSTVYGIVKQSGGFIWVYSEVGQGTSFKIYLPQVADVAGGKRHSPTVAPAHGTETILLVEDVEGLRKLTKRMLESAGYTVLTAANGEEALLMLERDDKPLHLMVTDVVMPGMSGRTLAEQFDATRPGMKVLYMSGYTDDVVVRHGVLDEGMPFLAKPFTAVELTRKVREVLDSQS